MPSAFDVVTEALKKTKQNPTRDERAAAFDLALRATGGTEVFRRNGIQGSGVSLSPHMLALFGFDKNIVQD